MKKVFGFMFFVLCLISLSFGKTEAAISPFAGIDKITVISTLPVAPAVAPMVVRPPVVVRPQVAVRPPVVVRPQVAVRPPVVVRPLVGIDKISVISKLP